MIAVSRPGTRLGIFLDLDAERGLVAHFYLRRDHDRRQRNIPVHSSCCAGPALGAMERFRRPGDCADRIPSHLPLLSESLDERLLPRPHILATHARGLGKGRVLLCHVVPVVAPQLLALAGVSVSIAVARRFLEALCGLPGIGQLAWQAALARDLPLLVNITILVTLVTLLANSSADVIGYMVQRRRA